MCVCGGWPYSQPCSCTGTIREPASRDAIRLAHAVHAYLPAEASFGFLDELRRRSSGAASASLLLSHWERLAVDPFFVPTTEEEREEWGEEGQGVGAANLAKKLISATRRRKGLPVEEKVVESATKQRTRARKV